MQVKGRWTAQNTHLQGQPWGRWRLRPPEAPLASSERPARVRGSHHRPPPYQGPSVGWSPLAPQPHVCREVTLAPVRSTHTWKSSAPRPRTAGRPPGRGPTARGVSRAPRSPPAEGVALSCSGARGLWRTRPAATPAVPPVAHKPPLLQKFGGRARLARPRGVRCQGQQAPPKGDPVRVWQPGVLEQGCDEARAVPCELRSHSSAGSSAGRRPSPPGASGRGCVRVRVATGVWGLRTRPCGGTGQAG